MRSLPTCVLGCLLIGAGTACAQYTFITNNGAITITGSTAQGSVSIPSTINGLPVKIVGNGGLVFTGATLTNLTIPDSVTTIGASAFENSDNLANVTIGNGVNSIGISAFEGCFSLTNVTIGAGLTNLSQYAFEYCSDLASISFAGNAPALGYFVFDSDPVTVYFLPGTTGWGSTLGGAPTTYWLLPWPVILNPGFTGTAQNRQFGFTVSWATSATVVVDGCTNLLNPVWQPLQTNTFSTGSFQFGDSQQANTVRRFYRVRSQ